MSASPGQVLTQLRRPRWIALTAFLVLLIVAFSLLSRWQFQRATLQMQAAEAGLAQPQSVDSLVPTSPPLPDSSLGRLVILAGEYVEHSWVSGRSAPDGSAGRWLVSALDDGSGAVTAVVRGWMPDDSIVPPSGVVRVTGRVHADEHFYSGLTARGADEVATITSPGLQEQWRTPTRPGYVVLTGQVPALTTADPIPVPPVFGAATSVAFPWQNVAYALQWLLFLGFAGFFYWRWFSDDLHETADQAPEQPAPVRTG